MTSSRIEVGLVAAHVADEETDIEADADQRYYGVELDIHSSEPVTCRYLASLSMSSVSVGG